MSSPYSRTSLPLPGMHPPGPVYSSMPAPGFSGVPAGHPFAQSSVSVPGVPTTSPKRKPSVPEPAKRPQSAPPPPPSVVEKRPSAVLRDRPPPPPAKDASPAGSSSKPDAAKAAGGGDKAKQPQPPQKEKKDQPAKPAQIGRQPSVPGKAAGTKFTPPWSFTSTEPEFPPLPPRQASMSRTMLMAELDPAPPAAATAVAVTVTEPEEKKRGWTKVKRALTGGNFRRSGRKPKKLELDLDGLGKLDFGERDRLSPLPPVPPEKLDMTPREIEMSGGGHGRRWEAPMSAGYNVPSVYAGMPGGSHYDLRTSTIGYFPGHFVASAVDVGAVGGLKGSRTLSGVKGGAW